MIYLLELPEDAPPRCWFAFDADDLRAKLDAAGGPPGHEIRVWPDEPSAVLAFEKEADPLWAGPGWHARRALYEQLLATEALAEG